MGERELAAQKSAGFISSHQVLEDQQGTSVGVDRLHDFLARENLRDVAIALGEIFARVEVVLVEIYNLP